MFIATLIVGNWEHCKCPSMFEWLNKLCLLLRDKKEQIIDRCYKLDKSPENGAKGRLCQSQKVTDSMISLI